MRYWLCILLVLGVCLAPKILCAELDGELGIPLTSEIGKNLQEELKDCRPSAANTPQSKINQAGSQIFYGNIFDDGKTSALVEFSGGLGYCVWRKDHWEPLKAWNIPVTWRPTSWKATSDDYLPTTPVEKPFQPLDLGHLRLIVVAGEVQKYYQQFYLLQSIGEHVEVVQSSMEKPEIKAGFLILEDHSGRRATWGETHYFKAAKGRLVAMADWREDVPYDASDDGWNTARNYSNGKPEAEFLIRYSDDEKEGFDVEIVRVPPGTSDDGKSRKENFALGERYATLKFRLLKEKQADADNEAEMAYLFEKLTHLPRNLYPGIEPGKQKLEAKHTVTIAGSKEAIERLSVH